MVAAAQAEKAADLILGIGRGEAYRAGTCAMRKGWGQVTLAPKAPAPSMRA